MRETVLHEAQRGDAAGVIEMVMLRPRRKEVS